MIRKEKIMKKWMMLMLLATCTLGAQAADREMKAANALCELREEDQGSHPIRQRDEENRDFGTQTDGFHRVRSSEDECGSLSECIPENWLRSESVQALKKGAPESDRCPFFRIHARKLFRFFDPLPVKGIADTCQ